MLPTTRLATLLLLITTTALPLPYEPDNLPTDTTYCPDPDWACLDPHSMCMSNVVMQCSYGMMCGEVGGCMDVDMEVVGAVGVETINANTINANTEPAPIGISALDIEQSEAPVTTEETFETTSDSDNDSDRPVDTTTISAESQPKPEPPSSNGNIFTAQELDGCTAPPITPGTHNPSSKDERAVARLPVPLSPNRRSAPLADKPIALPPLTPSDSSTPTPQSENDDKSPEAPCTCSPGENEFGRFTGIAGAVFAVLVIAGVAFIVLAFVVLLFWVVGVQIDLRNEAGECIGIARWGGKLDWRKNLTQGDEESRRLLPGTVEGGAGAPPPTYSVLDHGPSGMTLPTSSLANLWAAAPRIVRRER